MKICIDPGHGGKEVGSKGFGLNEKDINLKIALALEKKLKDEDIKVYMTRREDRYLTLKERTDIINNLECDLAISIHNNSSSRESSKGSEIIYQKGSNRGKELSNYILDNLGEIGLVKRRAFYRVTSTGSDYYYMIRESKKISIIIECGFLTNNEDNKLLSDDCFIEKLVSQISEGILKYRVIYHKDEVHWAKNYFDSLVNKGIIKENHDLDAPVKWGDLSFLVSNLLDYKSKDNDN